MIGRLPEGTISGEVSPRGNLALGRVVAALEFSHRENNESIGQPNIDIAERLTNDPAFDYMELICSPSIAEALRQIKSHRKPARIFDGPSAEGLQEKTGTHGELKQTKQFMEDRCYEKDELVLLTNGHNMGNVIRQTELPDIGLDPIVPHDLPGGFDKKSNQPWTKFKLLWIMTSHLRIAMLKRKGH